MAGGSYHGYNRAVHRALVLSLALMALPAAAAQFRSATVEEATRTSDAVVRGRVEQRTSRYLEDGSRIVTDVEIAVASAWKGDPGARVVVTVPGGVVGDVGMWVDAAPVLEQGEEVVLFLARRGPRWHVNGLALGKFRVAGPDARPQVPPEEMVRAATRPGELPIGSMAVGELERRVRAVR